ncbi:hypothetical protein M408DRAFT_26037 [Serendipita vermifera MAFF 305830]|uniref:Berberine/berberine-like domain-containing protein n=1 Tax=Serendipita vermifera MAFF 305830 TaxID=933852 RepID=A0A0C2X925_SERVB|nr:hypothetical protein M408DRAFT_26037 [Serendipita vermifera MAFF 305830]
MFDIRSNEFKTCLLAAGFTGDLVLSGDADYASYLVRFAKNSQKNAALVAFVKSAEDVSRIIKIFKSNGLLNPTFTETANSKSTGGARTLYAGNYPRLQDVKRKYDPDMMFKSWYPIRPLTAEA